LLPKKYFQSEFWKKVAWLSTTQNFGPIQLEVCPKSNES